MDGRAQPVQPLARLRADAQHWDRRAAVDVIQLLRRVEVALVQTHKHLAALEPRDGAHAVDQVRIRHRDGGGGKDHQLVDVRGGGTGKDVFPFENLLDHALAAVQLQHLDPVAHEGAHPRAAELPAGAAGAEHPADIDVIEPAQGFFNASRAQKVISFEDVLSPKCASTCAVVPLVPVKVKLTLSSSVLIDFEPTALPS